jgi:UrcA family protein
MNATNRIAGLATLVLAAIPALALTSAAHAASISVKVSDLNLNTPAGVTEMNHRINAAANAYCAQRVVTGTRLASSSCKAAVREEISQKLNAGRTYAAR